MSGGEYVQCRWVCPGGGGVLTTPGHGVQQDTAGKRAVRILTCEAVSDLVLVEIRHCLN